MRRWATGDVNGDGFPDIFVVQGATSSGNAPDLMLVNNGQGTAFTSIPVPQAGLGQGLNAYPINFEQNGLADFLVLNGPTLANSGPVQLIASFPSGG